MVMPIELTTEEKAAIAVTERKQLFTATMDQTRGLAQADLDNIDRQIAQRQAEIDAFLVEKAKRQELLTSLDENLPAV